MSNKKSKLEKRQSKRAERVAAWGLPKASSTRVVELLNNIEAELGGRFDEYLKVRKHKNLITKKEDEIKKRKKTK